MSARRHLYFPRNERRALLVVMACVAAGAVWLYCSRGGILTSEERHTDSASIANKDIRPSAKNGQGKPFGDGEARPAQRFAFDPNTADSTQLLRLGLSRWQVGSIYRYREHGGVFRKAEDFKHVRGLTARQYREMLPYIRIADDFRPADEVYQTAQNDQATHRDTLLYPLKLRPGQHVILNRADTTELKKVPGIGSRWAAAIAKYGQRLGGYCRVSQLKEISGFPEEALPYFVIESPKTIKLDINKTSVSRLRNHPYINFYQASAIRNHIRRHGPVRNMADLAQYPEFPPSECERLKPYISF